MGRVASERVGKSVRCRYQFRMPRAYAPICRRIARKRSSIVAAEPNVVVAQPHDVRARFGFIKSSVAFGLRPVALADCSKIELSPQSRGRKRDCMA